jgi:hypothetical protein
LYNTSHRGHGATSSGLLLGRDDSVRQTYSQVLSVVRMIMIQRMAKPSEVLIVKDPDTGEVCVLCVCLYVTIDKNTHSHCCCCCCFDRLFVKLFQIQMH